MCIYISQFDIPIIYLNDTVQEIHQLVTIVNWIRRDNWIQLVHFATWNKATWGWFQASVAGFGRIIYPSPLGKKHMCHRWDSINHLIPKCAREPSLQITRYVSWLLKEDQWTISGSAVTPESLKIRSPMEPGGCGWGEVWGWHTRSFFEVVLVVANVYYIYIIAIIYYTCVQIWRILRYSFCQGIQVWTNLSHRQVLL